MKPFVIIQPLFMGDIFFCMKIAAVAAAKGHNVVFPIHDQYESVRDSIILPDRVSMPLMSSNFELKGEYNYINSMCEKASSQGDFQYHEGPIETESAFYLALNSSWRKTRDIQIMRLKYEVAGIDHSDWPNYVNIKRDPAKETSLSEVIGVTNSPYILLNEHGRVSHRPVPIGGSVIRMSNIPGFSLFHWCGVIEKASEIISIDTSVVLLIEVLKPKSKLQIFSRYVPGDFTKISAVLRLNWHFANCIDDLVINEELAVKLS